MAELVCRELGVNARGESVSSAEGDASESSQLGRSYRISVIVQGCRIKKPLDVQEDYEERHRTKTRRKETHFPLAGSVPSPYLWVIY